MDFGVKAISILSETGRVTAYESDLIFLVILNLFQDPFLGLFCQHRNGVNLPVGFSLASGGRAAQWVLKQVQDDELFICDSPAVPGMN